MRSMGICGFLVALLSPMVSLAQIHVATTGNDSNTQMLSVGGG